MDNELVPLSLVGVIVKERVLMSCLNSKKPGSNFAPGSSKTKYTDSLGRVSIVIEKGGEVQFTGRFVGKLSGPKKETTSD